MTLFEITQLHCEIQSAVVKAAKGAALNVLMKSPKIPKDSEFFPLEINISIDPVELGQEARKMPIPPNIFFAEEGSNEYEVLMSLKQIAKSNDAELVLDARPQYYVWVGDK